MSETTEIKNNTANKESTTPASDKPKTGGEEGRSNEGGYRNNRGGYQGRRVFRRSKVKVCPFCADANLPLDYKEVPVLKRFITERGKIIPRRISGVCAFHQRVLTTQIKRARYIGFLPYSTVNQTLV